MTPTHADNCERLVQILADAPLEGMSLHGIQDKSEAIGERWPLRIINMLLLDLGSTVTHQKVRTRYGKVTLYQLRRP